MSERGGAEAPDSGRPAASTFDTADAVLAAAAYGLIQRPVWERYLAAIVDTGEPRTGGTRG